MSYQHRSLDRGTAEGVCVAFGPRAVLEDGFPAPDKSECADQRADIKPETTEAVWSYAPEGRQDKA